MTASDRARELVLAAAAAADDKQGTDLVALDVSGLIAFTDAFLLASARNERQVQSIAEAIEERLLELDPPAKALRREGVSAGRWALLDFGDLVVHVFHEEERTYYSLERLWRDCPVLPTGVPVATSVE